MSGGGLPDRPLNLMLVCGEPSGDQLGAQPPNGVDEAQDFVGLAAIAQDHDDVV